MSEEEKDSGLFVDVANRVITLFGTLGWENCNELIHNLYVMDIESPEDIDLIINSIGGDSEQTLAIIDTIKSLNSKVNTHAVGNCMSAAPWILAAGTGERTASKRCIFMTHFGYWEVGDKGKDQFDAWIDYRDLCLRYWYEVASENTGQSIEVISALSHDRDRYFTSEEAQQLGFIDKVA